MPTFTDHQFTSGSVDEVYANKGWVTLYTEENYNHIELCKEDLLYLLKLIEETN